MLVLLVFSFPLQSVTMKLFSEPWEFESDEDEVEEEYGSTEEVFSN